MESDCQDTGLEASEQTSPLYRLLCESSTEHVVDLIHSPSPQLYQALHTRIKHATPEFLVEFLHMGGLQGLLKALVELTSPGFTSLTDAILQLDCLGCVNLLLETRIGMSHLLDMDTTAVNSLVLALNTPNVHPKKLLVELLTAVCLYNKRGQQAVLDAFTHYKVAQHEHHTYSLLVRELRLAEAPSYTKALLGLTNALVSALQTVQERCRLRQQLIGLGLMDAINNLRMQQDKEADLAVQLEKFDEQKHEDDELLMRLHPSVDVTSAVSVSQALADRVFGKPESTYFLHVLQDLYSIDLRSKDRSMLWPVLAMTTSHIANLKDQSEVDGFLSKLREFLEPPQVSSKTIHEDLEEFDIVKHNAQFSNQLLAETEEVFVNNDAILTCSPDMKINDRRDSGISVGSFKDSLSITGSLSPYDNSGVFQGFQRRSSKRESGRSQRKLTLDTVPENDVGCISVRDDGKAQEKQRPDTPTIEECPVKPAFKPALARRPTSLPLVTEVEDVNEENFENVKTVRWIKLPDNIARGEMCIWKKMNEVKPTSLCIDTTALKKEFVSRTEKLLSCDDEVHLLPASTALQLNLWLARMEGSPEEVIAMISEGEATVFGTEALRQLLQILPSAQEIEQVQSYPGSQYDLAPAEHFLWLLAKIPEYRTLLDGLLFKAEFDVEIPKLKSGLDSLIKCSRDVLHHEGFKQFLKLLLNAGNTLNQGSHLQHASGICLSSLIRANDVKGSHHHVNLLSWVVRQAEIQKYDCLHFTDDFTALELAVKQNNEHMKTIVSDFNTRLKKLVCGLKQTSTLSDLFDDFIEDVKLDVEEVQEKLACLQSFANQLAVYFGEDLSSFDIVTCFQKLNEFVTQVRRCQRGGIILRDQQKLSFDHLAALQSDGADNIQATQFGKKADLCSSMMSPNTDHIVKNILDQVARGNVKKFYSNDFITPGSDADDFFMSRISPERQSFDLEKSAMPQTPQTPDGDLELSLDMDGLALQPSTDELSVNVNPQLLGEFKATVCRNKPLKLQFDSDNLQSTPIAGNIKKPILKKHIKVKKCLLGDDLSPVKYCKESLVKADIDKNNDYIKSKGEQNDMKNAIESIVTKPEKEDENNVVNKDSKDLMENAMRPLKLQIPKLQRASIAEPEDLSPISEQCLNTLEKQESLTVSSPMKTGSKANPSSNVVRIRYYPKYDGISGPYKPQYYELKKSCHQDLSAENAQNEYASSKQAESNPQKRVSLYTVKSEEIVAVTSPAVCETSKDDVFIFGSNKTNTEFHADLPIAQQYKYFDVHKATTKSVQEIEDPYNTVGKTDKKVNVLHHNEQQPMKKAVAGKSGQPIGIYRAPVISKPSQPQMGLSVMKCGSESNVNGERRGKTSPPLAEVDAVDALDLSSSVTPTSPDLQTKVLTAVCKKEEEAEKRKKETDQLKKKSHFGFFRRFHKAFRSSKEDERSHHTQSVQVIQNKEKQSDIHFGDPLDTSTQTSDCNEKSLPQGTVLSESFVMVKPSKDNDHGIRRLKSVMGFARTKKLQNEGKIAESAVDKRNADVDETSNDDNRGEKRVSNIRYPLVPRSSRSLDNQQKTPPTLNPRSSSLPAKNVISPDPWQKRSRVPHLTASERSKSCDENAKSIGPLQVISGSKSSIVSHSSAASSNSEGGKFRRPSAEGKRPRLASSRSSLSPPGSSDKASENELERNKKCSENEKLSDVGNMSKTDNTSSNIKPMCKRNIPPIAARDKTSALVFKPNNMYLDKNERQPSGRVYKPNPQKPAAFRDTSNNKVKSTLETDKSKPVKGTGISKLPIKGKENVSKKEMLQKPLVLNYYAKGSSIA